MPQEDYPSAKLALSWIIMILIAALIDMAMNIFSISEWKRKFQ